ncbi:protein MOTHER of FT and TFL1-like [Impatiens glandulifera]|uniref:protein MOTHER of FT and TFL1-like n=1 Tax=Impatiens glandulifera TaxID=253017 RepID=UPI001FB0EBEC|nr:protein MOTHER of FT and TFL1-like [Impatiens glandulifera]
MVRVGQETSLIETRQFTPHLRCKRLGLRLRENWENYLVYLKRELKGLSNGSSYTEVGSLMAASSINPLIMCKIIGDVVDPFVPTADMDVYYATKHVTNGCSIKPSMAFNPPTVTISGLPNELYTLVMTDPDMPSPSEPSMREWVHWIVANIPGGTNSGQGKEIVPYMEPCPAVGIHRYILILFRQSKYVDQTIEKPNIITRANFNTRAFSHHLCLGFPVAIVYFNAQKEPINQRNV